jgi:hypothetical protein
MTTIHNFRQRIGCLGLFLYKGMKLLRTWLTLVLACGWPGALCAQLQLLPDPEPQRVFAGEARKIAVAWHNDGDEIADAEIHARLYQTSSATAVLLKETLWKKIEILPGQTVLESAQMDFPPVDAKTQFLIQWLWGTNLVIGKSEVLVYPTNLLKELKSLLGEDAPGVLDPNDELKPLLKLSRVDFVDLGETSLEDFRGKLAVIGPFRSKTQVRGGLAQAIQRIAGKGVAVVWIQPLPEPKNKIKPSFYVVPEGKGAVVVVQSDLVAGLSENPRSQLNLIYFSKLALDPEPFPLPDLKTQP